MLHSKPVTSQTVLLPHLYENPAAAIAITEGVEVPETARREAEEHFANFYEEVRTELAK